MSARNEAAPSLWTLPACLSRSLGVSTPRAHIAVNIHYVHRRSIITVDGKACEHGRLDWERAGGGDAQPDFKINLSPFDKLDLGLDRSTKFEYFSVFGAFYVIDKVDMHFDFFLFVRV